MSIGPSGQTASQVNITRERMMELAEIPVKDWTDQEILGIVGIEFTTAKNFMRRKKQRWIDYTKLYLNQFRKDTNPDSLGSKLIFTKFHESYSAFSTDEKMVEFEPRSMPDIDIVKSTNQIAELDWDDFGGGEVWNEWLWDRLFYSFGVLDVSEYDRKQHIMRPRIQSPYTFFFDPLATNLLHARYAGNFLYATRWQMSQNSKFDEDAVDKMTKNTVISAGQNEDALNQEQARQILLGSIYYQEPMMADSYYEILRWYMKHMGKTYVIWTDSSVGTLLGWEEVKTEDGEEGESEFPYIIKTFYKSPISMMGVGIVDLLEDDHRADVRLINYMFEGIKLDSIPTFLYNYKAIMNPKDLSVREINKNIPFNEDPENKVMPFPKTGVVNNETMAFLNMIENRGEGAFGGSRLLRGAMQGQKVSATQIAAQKAKVDLALSARSKEEVIAEKRFWYVWLSRYRKNMDKNSEKFVRILGESGAHQFMQMKKDEFIPRVDPEIRVVSKLVSEPQRVMRRRDLAEMMEPAISQGAKGREILKILFYDIDLKKDDIDVILPPTPHELRAQEENEMINEDQYPLVHENDDDQTHISVHSRAKDNKARKAHIRAHVLNYLRKANLPPEGEEGEKSAPAGEGRSIPQNEKEIQRSNINLESILGGSRPSMTSAVK